MKHRLLVVLLVAGAVFAGWAVPVGAAIPYNDFFLAEELVVDAENAYIRSDTFSMNGVTYVHGMRSGRLEFEGDDGWSEWNLDRRCTSLSTTIGQIDDSSSDGTLQFEFWLDGVRVDTRTIGFGSTVPIELDVTNVLRLRIVTIVLDGSESYYGGFGDPMLRCLSRNHLGRLAGTNRMATAIAASQDAFPTADSAGAVVLTRSDNPADALAGTPLAVAKEAPLLLTPTATLDRSTASEIDRVLQDGGTVYVLGGTGAISDAVVDDLEDEGYDVVRYAGLNRFDTAVVIAELGLDTPSVVLLANGLGFHDALVAGAAAPAVNGAVLLTNGTSMPAESASYLQAHASTRYAVGNDAAAADSSAVALAGSTPWHTSVEVAERLLPSAPVVGLASTSGFADALSGGAHVGRQGGPLLWTEPTVLPSSVEDLLEDNRDAINAAYVYGGTGVVSDPVAAEIRSLI